MSRSCGKSLTLFLGTRLFHSKATITRTTLRAKPIRKKCLVYRCTSLLGFFLGSIGQVFCYTFLIRFSQQSHVSDQKFQQKYFFQTWFVAIPTVIQSIK